MKSEWEKFLEAKRRLDAEIAREREVMGSPRAAYDCPPFAEDRPDAELGDLVAVDSELAADIDGWEARQEEVMRKLSEPLPSVAEVLGIEEGD